MIQDTMYTVIMKEANTLSKQFMSIKIKGYVRMEQLEEFEAWEKEQLAKQDEYRKQAEKETNDYIKSVRAKNNGRIPMKSYEHQEMSFMNTNAYNNY